MKCIDYDTDCEDESDDDDAESKVNDVDFDVSMSEDEGADSSEIYPIEKRKEIIDFWLNGGGIRRKFSCVQRRYRKLSSKDILQKWKQRLYHKGICMFVSFSLCFYIFTH